MGKIKAKAKTSMKFWGWIKDALHQSSRMLIRIWHWLDLNFPCVISSYHALNYMGLNQIKKLPTVKWIFAKNRVIVPVLISWKIRWFNHSNDVFLWLEKISSESFCFEVGLVGVSIKIDFSGKEVKYSWKIEYYSERDFCFSGIEMAPRSLFSFREFKVCGRSQTEFSGNTTSILW